MKKFSNRVKVKAPSISDTIVHGTTCIHAEFDFEKGTLTESCGKPIVPEIIGKLTFGHQHRYLCKEHEYQVHYLRKRVQRDSN